MRIAERITVLHSRLFAVRLVSSAVMAVSALAAVSAQAQVASASTQVVAAKALSAEDFVKSITTEVFAAVKADKGIQSGDLRKIFAVVDAKIMPNVNFVRMTASAVGPAWRKATPEQRKRLEAEFKTLLVHTYAGAASQIKDQVVEYRPSRSRPDDTEVIVRTLVKGQGDPIQLDYRLEKAAGNWKIYDVNVMGAWLVQTHQSSFAQEINATGIDGLINKLAERNKQLAAKKSAA